MDAQAKKKAYRDKLIAHKASRKHHEAINKIQANAAGRAHVNHAKAETPVEMHKPKPVDTMELQYAKPEPSTGLPKPRPSSVLPADFFDNQEKKRQKTDAAKVGNSDSYKDVGDSSKTQVTEPLDSDNMRNGFSSTKIVETEVGKIQPVREHPRTSTLFVDSETKQVKGALPEGFFDDKDADLRARGITPVKLDAKDEYKEFEKLIQEDLKEVDNRLEEEEYDAAEMIDEAEHSEQKTLMEKVEMWKKKKMELKAARSSIHSRGSDVKDKESRHEESSSDDDSDENFTVDWRAKHL